MKEIKLLRDMVMDLDMTMEQEEELSRLLNAAASKSVDLLAGTPVIGEGDGEVYFGMSLGTIGDECHIEGFGTPDIIFELPACSCRKIEVDDIGLGDQVELKGMYCGEVVGKGELLFIRNELTNKIVHGDINDLTGWWC